MELIGLTLAQTIAVFGGVGAAVVAFYFLKLRRRQVEVPFSKLWDEVLAERQSTRLFSQLKRWLSLLLALSIVALLALALADPRLAGATAPGRTVVFLVDASGSMRATDVEPNRFALAKSRLGEFVTRLGPADRALIAEMGATTRPVSPLTGDAVTLRRGIEQLRATDTVARLDRGLRFARDVLREHARAELVLLSDGRFASELPDLKAELPEIKSHWVPIGTSRDNVAITSLAARRYPLDKSQSEVLVELYNPSPTPRGVELTLKGDGAALDVQELTLPPKERVRRFFHNLAGVQEKLEARLAMRDDRTDDLVHDNRAFARVPPRRRARVLAVSADNLYLSAALLLDEYLEVTEVTPPQYAPSDDFDVVIFDGFWPLQPPATDAIYLFPGSLTEAQRESAPFEVGEPMARPFFDRVVRDHPLVRWTALRDINVAEAWKVRPQKGDRVVAGDERGPLLITGTRGDHRVVAFTFDLRKSDLPLRVAWPVLLLNAIEWFADQDPEHRSSYRTGEAWHIPVPAGSKTARIEGPDGITHQVPVTRGRAVFSGQQAGFYTVHAGGQRETLAANAPAGEEANIAPAQSLPIPRLTDKAAAPSTPGIGREIWVYLLWLVVALLAIEWFTYHRRWTV